MQKTYVAWHCAWWNYHCSRARLHDDRISWLAGSGVAREAMTSSASRGRMSLKAVCLLHNKNTFLGKSTCKKQPCQVYNW